MSANVRRDTVPDLLPAVCLYLPLLLQLADRILRGFLVPYQVSDDVRLDVEELSDLPLSEALLAQASQDLLEFVETELLLPSLLVGPKANSRLEAKHERTGSMIVVLFGSSAV